MLTISLILCMTLVACTPVASIEYQIVVPKPKLPSIGDWQGTWPSQRMKKYDCVETQPLQRAHNGETQETAEPESRIDTTVVAGKDQEGAGSRWA